MIDSKEAVREGLAQATGEANPVNSALALWQFSHEVKVGDVVIAKKGRGVAGWGMVSGDYEFDPDCTGTPHTRKMEWHAVPSVHAPERLGIAVKTLTDVRPYPEVVRTAFALDAAGTRRASAEGSEPGIAPAIPLRAGPQGPSSCGRAVPRPP